MGAGEPPAAAPAALQDENNVHLILDVDGTLSIDDASLPYPERRPRTDVIERIRALHRGGVRVILYSARNMRTYAGKVGEINAKTLPDLVIWLDRHKVPYDELHMGKPWCGHNGFYVADQALRPSQLVAQPLGRMDELVAEQAVAGAAS